MKMFPYDWLPIKNKLLLILTTILIMGWALGMKNNNSEMGAVLHKCYIHNCVHLIRIKKYRTILWP